MMFILIWFSTAVFASQSIFIYRDYGHKGDENQIRGVIEAYRAFQPDCEESEFNVGEEEQLKEALSQASQRKGMKPLLLAVGEKTVSSLMKLSPCFEKAITVHICHMLTSHHASLINKIDGIAVPVHAVGAFEDQLKNTKTHLISTVGVAHNRQIDQIERVYQKRKGEIPPSESYLGVILGGDAPTPENEMRLFTEENARKLARYISRVRGNKHLLIINGPRTGKYHSETKKEIKTVHREGRQDLVTQAFLDELQKNEIPSSSYSLFDFQFASSTPEEMDFVLGTIRATPNSIVLVPGESTSSISECIDVLPYHVVYVYPTTSMNSVHQAHVQSELDAGRIQLLTKDFKEVRKNPQSKESSPQGSAAETIAKALLDLCKKE